MYSILYVDDEPNLLQIAKIFLERSGDFRVGTMPEMDGIAFLKAVRERFGDIPFILFTGRGREEVVINAINNGADFYIQKGGDPKTQYAELAHQIKKAIERHQAQSALKDSEQRLSDIINFLPDATFVIDRSGHVIAWNRAIEEMTKVPAEEILGKGDYEYAIPFYGERRPILIDLIYESDKVIANNYAHIIHDKNFLIADTTLPRPKGKSITLMGKASPLYNRHGEIVGAIESIRDITEMKNTEDKLRASYAQITASEEELRQQFDELKKSEDALCQSEGKYRSILENIQDAYYRTDPAGNLLLASPSAARLLGYDSVSELIGKNVAQTVYYNPEERSKLLDEVNSSGSVTDYEVTLKKRDGTTVCVSTSSHKYYNSSGNFLGIEGIFRDVTERNKSVAALSEAKEKIQQSEEFLRTVISSAKEGIVVYDRDLRIILWNRFMEEMTGLQAADVQCKETFTLFPFLKEQGVDTLMKQALAGTASESSDFGFLIHSTGKNGWVKGVYSPNYDSHGTIVGVIGIIRDITERKNVENALRESEAKYRHLIETANEGLWVIDHELKTTFINQRFADMLGYSPEEMVGNNVLDYVISEDKAVMEEQFVTRRSGIKSRYKCRLVHRDGRIVWCLISGSPFLDKNGSFQGSFGMVMDITELKQAKEALLESEKRFRELADLLPQVVYEVDTSGNLTYANHTAFERFGYTDDEFRQGLTIWQMFDSDDLERVSADFRTMIEGKGGRENKGEYLALRKDGSTFPVTIYSSPIVANGRITGLRGIIVEFTERRRAESKISERGDKFRQLAEMFPETIFESDAEGRVTYANKHGLKEFGCTAEDLSMGLNIFGLVSPEDRTKVIRRVQEKIQGSPNKYMEYRALRKDGSTFWALAFASPFIVNGKHGGLRGFIFNITERKNTEETLHQASRKLTILSNITRHDILNQLMGLRGYLELSKEKVKDPVILKYILKEEQVAETIQGQIEFSRNYQDIGGHAPNWQSVSKTISSAVSQLNLSGVEIDVAVDRVEVFADSLLVKVFYNLMENSLRHGDHVTRMDFSVQESEKGLILIYRDNGVGISAEDKKKLFHQGFGKHTGLGLFLSREILSITGITITENGEPGKETRFEIQVPKGAYRIRNCQV